MYDVWEYGVMFYIIMGVFGKFFNVGMLMFF